MCCNLYEKIILSLSFPKTTNIRMNLVVHIIGREDSVVNKIFCNEDGTKINNIGCRCGNMDYDTITQYKYDMIFFHIHIDIN